VKGPTCIDAAPVFEELLPLSKNIALVIIVIKSKHMQQDKRCFRVKLLFVGR